ncbi:MAG: helix-turn-helix transcriptional regulator [Candidatus Puniceispirillum sp.]
MPNRNIFQNDEEDSTLGGRISQAREASGMSVAEVVKQLGVRAKTYEAWESDRSEPRANKLVALAGILNVSPPYLLGGLGVQPSKDKDDTPDMDALAEQIKQIEKSLKDASRALRRLKALTGKTK